MTGLVAFLRIRHVLIWPGIALLFSTGFLAYRCNPQLVDNRVFCSASREERVIRDYPAFQPDDRERFVAALNKCTPALASRDVSDLLHCMLLCGGGHQLVSPVDERCMAPVEDILLDHNVWNLFFPNLPPPVESTRYGLRFSENIALVARNELNYREAHVGQTLFVLGRHQQSVDRPVVAGSKTGILRDVLDDLVANFSLAEELDWTVASLALYLPPRDRWTNKYKQTFSFSELADTFLERPFGKGSPCVGTHTLYTLALLRQVDEHDRILERGQRQRIEAYLRGAVERLSRTQRADGSWGLDWASSAVPGESIDHHKHDGPWITGHHLEWMSIVPGESRLPPQQLRQAADFVVKVVAREERSEILRYPCHFSHGVRAAAVLADCFSDKLRVPVEDSIR